MSLPKSFIFALVALVVEGVVLDPRAPVMNAVEAARGALKAFATRRAQKLQGAGYKNLGTLDESAMLSLERAPSTPAELYSKPWNARWTPLKRLGAGGFGEAWLVQNIADNALAVIKRAPHPGRPGDYVRWGDYKSGNAAIDSAIEGMRDECTWAYYLQKFGIDFRYITRFLFMQCWETNISPLTAVNHPDPSHELYLIVNFAGKELTDLKFTSPQAVANVLGQMANALHYMKLAGIVHHDLKAANILYSENVDSSGHAAGGHIVVIDYGAMVPVDRVVDENTDDSYTPGYIPYGFLEKVPMDPATSFDAFSMACTIAEVVCGSNIVQPYVINGHPFPTNWQALENDFSQGFQGIALSAAARHDALNGTNKQQVLIALMQEYPMFMTHWRNMFSLNPQIRDQAGVDLWKLFIKHDGQAGKSHAGHMQHYRN